MVGYLKKSLIVVLCLMAANATAQLTAGAEGLTVKEGGHLHISGLEIRPSVDLNINGLTITRSNTPATGDNGSGIARVYQFSSPLSFLGTLRLYYQTDELNGNAEADLVLAYKPGASQSYVLSQTSTVSLANHTVENTFANINLFNLTATGRLVTLPLQLLHFNAVVEGSRGRIYWSTSEETGVRDYRVLRSMDGKAFDLLEQIGSKVSGSDTKNYVVYDGRPILGQNYYKLEEVDVQGEVHELGIRSMYFGLANGGFMLFPNPGNGPFFLNVGDASADELAVSLFDSQGKLISREKIMVQKGQQQYPILKGRMLVKGVYVVRIQGDNEMVSLKLAIP